MKDAEKWISIASALSPLVDFAICHVNGSIVREVGLQALEHLHHHTMEISYCISNDYWHRGMATKVITAFSNSLILLDIWYDSRLGSLD
jgi:RimJ/RimL family protein N-acetyltransferase